MMSPDINIMNNTYDSINMYGIYLLMSGGVVIEGNHLNGTADGLLLYMSDRVNVTDNHISNSSGVMQRDSDSGLFALLFALPLVYMLMAALFESFAQPLTIMFSIPFALLGVGVAAR